MGTLTVLSILAGLFGLLSLTQATMGVGIICAACLLGILARITQAHEYHLDLLNKLKSEHDSRNLDLPEHKK